jgi:SAM-dependent methyltransferase
MAMGEQFHFDPASYADLITSEVPAYHRLQDTVAEATMEIDARRILDLGAGTGMTAYRVAARHPDAKVVGIDENAAMLEYARRLLPHADFRVARIEDDLPTGPFDVVVSALAVHHLDAPHKADLFVRVAGVVAPGGRFVLGDVIVPDDPADVVTPIDGEYDHPSTIAQQLQWLTDAGFVAHTAWIDRDLAVLVGDPLADRQNLKSARAPRPGPLTNNPEAELLARRRSRRLGAGSAC